MKEQMYMCYMEDGRNRIYCNPHTGRAKPDTVYVNLKDGAEICENAYGSRCLEYKGIIYTDHEIRSNQKGQIFVKQYRMTDVSGEPTGNPIPVGKLVDA